MVSMDKFCCPGCHYAVLGVEKDSSVAEIRTAYRKMAMRWHPDKCANAIGDARERAKLNFQTMEAATDSTEVHAVLSDEIKRKLYDAEIKPEDIDPSAQDFIKELIKMMKRETPFSSKSEADREFAELGKLYMNIANIGSNVRKRQQFHLGTSPSRKEYRPEPRNTGSTSNASLHTASSGLESDCSDDSFDSARSSSKGEESATYCSEPHSKRYKNSQQSEGSLHGVEYPQTHAQYKSDDSGFEEEHPEVGSRHDDISPSKLNFGGFCMGDSGDSFGRDYRGKRTYSKLRRKKTEGKMEGVGSSSSICDVCGNAKIGLGPFCFCTTDF